MDTPFFRVAILVVDPDGDFNVSHGLLIDVEDGAAVTPHFFLRSSALACRVALGIVTLIFGVMDDMHALVAGLLLKGRFHATADVRHGDVSEVPDLAVVPTEEGQVVFHADARRYADGIGRHKDRPFSIP